MIILILSIGMFSYSYADILHLYNGSDTSEDGVTLTFFSVEGDRNITVGNTIYVNFTFVNSNKFYLYNFTAFIAVEKPGEDIIYKPIVENLTLDTGYRAIANTTILLDKPGSWSIWPYYEAYLVPDSDIDKIEGPIYWHAYNFTVEELLPDLSISNVNCNWEEKRISFTVINTGDAIVREDFTIALYVNGEEIKEKMVTYDIKAGGEYTSYFNAADILYGNRVDITLVVDPNNMIIEEDEENNHYSTTCIPEFDTTPPLFISGPEVIDITSNSATIRWETDETSDGKVSYGEKLGEIEGIIDTSGSSREHQVVIGNLKRDTVYHYKVEVWDENGNKAYSKTLFFKTKIERDSNPPYVSLKLKTNISKPFMISPDVSDDTGINHVTFYLDGKPLFTDYSPPYDFPFDPSGYKDGHHDLGIQVVDVTGNIVDKHIGVNISQNPQLFKKPPEVTILTPSDGGEVIGDTLITARINHTSGIDRVEFYIDSELWDVSYGYVSSIVEGPEGMLIKMIGKYDELPFNETFHWYAQPLEYISSNTGHLVENKSTIIEVRAYDENGSMGRDSIVVYHKWESPREPSLGVYREVRREGNYFIMDVTVINHGYGTAYDVSLTDRHYSFQVGHLISSDIPAHYELHRVHSELYSSYETHYRPYSSATFYLNDSLSGLSKWRFSYELFPLLSNDMVYGWFEIAAKSILQYRNSSRLIDIISRMNNTYEPSPGWTAQQVSYAFEQSDYIIVTNPFRLYEYNSNSMYDVNELLLAMIELAREKRGVVGYILSDISASDIHHEINHWGENYLNNSWHNHGYLLLVGETEIIPSFIRHWDRDFDSRDETIYCTDYPYANTGGREVSPELHIGRIIGNNASDLIIPIRSSLEVHYGQVEFKRGWENGKALCISGAGEGEGTFWSSVEYIANMMSNAGYQTVTIRGGNYDSIVNRSFRFRENVSDCSVIYYRDHGDNNGKAWSGVASTYNNAVDSVYLLSLGNTHPFIFSCCCCAGQYEDNPNYSPGGENGVAEGFMKMGAGVYIGPTEVSNREKNNRYSDYFFSHWIGHPAKSISQAWKETRREAADEWWFENDRYWSAEYQFYGDPKFGE